MAFDPNSPTESHTVLSGDINQIRENCVQLRKHESGASAPSNLVAGMLWHDTTGPYLKVRKADNGSWLYVLLGTAPCTEGQILATPAEINKACDLTSNGFFTSGGVRKILLYENVAPTGWTIQNTLDDKLVFVTKGSAAGGQTGGTVHSTGSWTISGLAHTHTGPSHAHTTAAGRNANYYSYDYAFATSGTFQSSAVTTAGAATYTMNRFITGAGGTGATGSGGGSDGAWRPAAYCCIIAALD